LAAEALNLREGEAGIFFMAAYLPDWEERERVLRTQFARPVE